MMEILEQLFALVTYPVAILVLGLVFMLLFQGPISRLLEGPVGRLLDRTRKIGTSGLEADAHHQDAKTVAEIKASAAEVFERMFPNELLAEREGNVRQVLDTQNLRDNAEREKYLVRLVAGAGLITQFEVTYRAIFGSQLAALTALNSAPMDPALVCPLYDFAAGGAPQFYQGYSFEQWLNFMINNGLVVRIPNGPLTITIQGREFLKYITAQGYSIAKLG